MVIIDLAVRVCSKFNQWAPHTGPYRGKRQILSCTALKSLVIPSRLRRELSVRLSVRLSSRRSLTPKSHAEVRTVCLCFLPCSEQNFLVFASSSKFEQTLSTKHGKKDK